MRKINSLAGAMILLIMITTIFLCVYLDRLLDQAYMQHTIDKDLIRDLQLEKIDLNYDLQLLKLNRDTNVHPIAADTDITEIRTTLEDIAQYINDNDLDLEAGAFYGLAEFYGIDPGFALATWGLETGWGSSVLWRSDNNPAGIVCSGVYCSYESKEDGMAAMFELLQRYINGSIEYVGKRNTLVEVRNMWSETDDVDDILDIWKHILKEEGK